ncbi:30S ribosomal protein S4 [Candidatus Kaiserbacteria bacterium]|nr:30S ribosomal protein S4 [Candidatus Kaiserbacteria bacterium]
MIIGPKFKICKRLGGAVFEKCQTQKFTLVEARKKTTGGRGKRQGAASDYKRQLIEKQKMRYMYGLSETQLSRYVDESIEKSDNPSHALMTRLESRLDNVVYRLGLARTRRLARQMVSHGHITVNGRKVTVPSYLVVQNQQVAVRDGSKESVLFQSIREEGDDGRVPVWLSFDRKALAGSVTAVPSYDAHELLFDLEQVFEYYSR